MFSTPDNHLKIREIYSFCFMCLDVLPAYISVICVLGAHGGQKGAWEPLELELEMVDSCLLVLGWNLGRWRSSSCS